MASAAASGCEWEVDGAVEQVVSGGWESGGGNGCPPEECGMNGTELSELRVGSLDLDGAPNRRGLAIAGFLGADTGRERDLMIDVRGGALVAVTPSSGAVAVAEQGLVGGAIVLEQVRPHGARIAWTLWIEGVGAASRWSSEGGAVPTYRFSIAPRRRPDKRRWLCPDGAVAALIAGERYDAETLAIDAAGPERWLTFACEGDLRWKAARMSYDPMRDAGDPYVTTAAQRRATLGMIAADYCGTGERFTEPGTALYWQNRAGWMVVGGSPAPTATVEAGWNERGAVCLNAPRLADVYTRQEIEAACGRAIPTCTPALLGAAEWITWRP